MNVAAAHHFSLPDAFREQVKIIADESSTDPDERSSIREILVALFPQAAESSYYDEEQSLRERRVCHPKHFNKYFQLALEGDDISAALLDRIINKSHSRDELLAIFKDAKDGGKILDLLEAVYAIRERIPTENLTSFVTAIFDIGDNLPADADDLFLSDAEMTGIRIVYHRIKEEATEKIVEVLSYAYDNTTGIVIPIRFLGLEDEKSREMHGADHFFLIPVEMLPDFKAKAIQLIKHREHTELLNLRKCSAILFRWADWEGDAIVMEWTSKVIEEPTDALTLLVRLLNATYSDGRLAEYWLSGESIEALVDMDKLWRSIQKLDRKGLDGVESQAFDLLELTLKRKSEGKDYKKVHLKGEEW